ncbi:glycosyltransferase involved in cell wall biosynthesis [Nitrosospira multiformis]|uniref:Glycosyltransferase involved in cell wall biosynthesis n=2 Tax=Nitrosospira multiformis TaxID=1231 RepID=A0A2T5I5Q5_9PROT|nr:glycosyltransferase involved in cell wall biosynthesis [Nitrosospira multiformis]
MQNANKAGASKRKAASAPLLSVVVPAFNEEEVLPAFHSRLSSILSLLDMEGEIIYVNDGSTDRTIEIIQELKRKDSRVSIVDLSRNFGKEIALTAGLDHARGDAIVVIDADLQDPPELIQELIKQWRQGYDVVYATRTRRDGESAIKKATAYGFYRLIQKISRVKIPEDTGDFRLLSRRAVDGLVQLREQHRFMKGLYAWVGFPQKAVFYRRDSRYAGQTKFNYWRLWNFALEGITSFTIAPLKMATYVGLFTAFGAFLYGSGLIIGTLLYGNPIAGYPSIMVTMLFLGGIQLITLGIIGEYLGRMFDEAKGRPLYLLNLYEPAELNKRAFGETMKIPD